MSQVAMCWHFLLALTDPFELEIFYCTQSLISPNTTGRTVALSESHRLTRPTAVSSLGRGRFVKAVWRAEKTTDGRFQFELLDHFQDKYDNRTIFIVSFDS